MTELWTKKTSSSPYHIDLIKEYERSTNIKTLKQEDERIRLERDEMVDSICESIEHEITADMINKFTNPHIKLALEWKKDQNQLEILRKKKMTAENIIQQELFDMNKKFPKVVSLYNSRSQLSTRDSNYNYDTYSHSNHAGNNHNHSNNGGNRHGNRHSNSYGNSYGIDDGNHLQNQSVDNSSFRTDSVIRDIDVTTTDN